MDPISQGAVGAGLAQSSSNGREIRRAALLGCLAGMAPDLDILIRSSTDPLLFLEYHRQFTHALLFVPMGALLAALVLHPLLAGGLPFRRSYLYCMLGYGTHGLLDACTSYGTLLLWPFSDARFAWNNVSVIDPLFTVPLLGCVIAGVARRKPAYAAWGMAWAVAYLALGQLQQGRVEAAAAELAAARGHGVERFSVKPGFGNLLVWKAVYETDTQVYVDAVRAGVSMRIYPGTSAPRLDVERHLPWLVRDSQQARDLQRFRWFSQGYLAMHPTIAARVIDVRYSVVPNEIEPLWGIQLDPDKPEDAHVVWIASRRASPEQRARLWQMVLGR